MKFTYLSLMLYVFTVLPLSAVWAQSLKFNSCLIGPSELKQAMSNNNIALVDLRSADDYTIFHIPRSINIKKHEIKTKVFLKGKQMMLIGYGYDTAMLLDTCKSLTSTGFESVQILENGMAGWLNEHHKQAISPEIYRSVFYLQPADIANITDIQHVLVINITGKNSDLLDTYFANVSSITAGNNKDLIKRLKKISISGKNQYHYIIVINRDGQDYPVLHELNQIENGMPVMFLSGGIDDLYRFDKNRLAISNKKEFTLQNLKGCGY